MKTGIDIPTHGKGVLMSAPFFYLSNMAMNLASWRTRQAVGCARSEPNGK
ncbi:MAG: hypothetical protein VX780_04710 [Pseudomonadota bacterium]|nr:hypothetical protein [Pseudomonadota bacterium]